MQRRTTPASPDLPCMGATAVGCINCPPNPGLPWFPGLPLPFPPSAGCSPGDDFCLRVCGMRIGILAVCLLLVSCSPTPITSFCDRTDLSEPAANYSVNYVKKPGPQFDASYWNLCGPAWTRGGASLVYSPAEQDL